MKLYKMNYINEWELKNFYNEKGEILMRNILSVEKIEKYYGNKDNVTKAIDNISFKVDEGEFVGIMGPSGSGKTTLLNCISTIDNVTTGKIMINNSDITRLKSKSLDKFRQNELGFIFQDFNLLDTLTAYENIALALTIKGVKSSKIDEKIQAVAKYLDIEQVLSKYPYQMSGGQKQRVGSARAIVTDPSLVLADEPTGSLDSKSARLLLERFESLNKDLKATILMVTHDAFTASYARRILFIKDGKIFIELVRGNDSRKEFFTKIMEVITLLGGDDNNVF
ncbi:bacitracin ABC efflux transporter (ATP-binding protein) [Bacillus mycoides]|uniref:Bacitracin ABC efflux transporter (ATP-binding protein) n=3 Tax=Bacillus TaxID=1386 RepID=A0A653ZWU6_BACMY|nr:bacitracin ABC efflux transporter (ATP-binding protein) [Bacillus mycoides]